MNLLQCKIVATAKIKFYKNNYLLTKPPGFRTFFKSIVAENEIFRLLICNNQAKTTRLKNKNSREKNKINRTSSCWKFLFLETIAYKMAGPA